MAFTNDMVIELGNRLNNAQNVVETRSVLIDYSNIPNISLSWKLMLIRIHDMLALNNGTPYKVFTKGNSKLPFYSYSELSLATCPGKGDCANYCYSLKGWRYPNVVGRQLQNMLLMQYSRQTVMDAFYNLPENITLRLYVDGDFSSSGVVVSWFQALKNRPDIQAYGYSKSFDEVYSNREIWPINYKLNLSNNGKIRLVDHATMKGIPGVRGEFIAVKIDPTLMEKSKRYSLDYHMAVRDSVREITGKTGFSCPGLCGKCNVKNTHACNSNSLKNIPIAIGIH
jgi:hypothetical protein